MCVSFSWHGLHCSLSAWGGGIIVAIYHQWVVLATSWKTNRRIIYGGGFQRLCFRNPALRLRSGDGEPPDHYEITYSVFSYSGFLHIADSMFTHNETSHANTYRSSFANREQWWHLHSSEILRRVYWLLDTDVSGATYMLHLVLYFPWRKDRLFVRKCQYITINIQTVWPLKMDR